MWVPKFCAANKTVQIALEYCLLSTSVYVPFLILGKTKTKEREGSKESSNL